MHSPDQATQSSPARELSCAPAQQMHVSIRLQPSGMKASGTSTSTLGLYCCMHAPHRDDDDKVVFNGWARMAVPLQDFSVIEVRKPNVGENKPASVTADAVFTGQGELTGVTSEDSGGMLLHAAGVTRKSLRCCAALCVYGACLCCHPLAELCQGSVRSASSLAWQLPCLFRHLQVRVGQVMLCKPERALPRCFQPCSGLASCTCISGG